MCHFTWITTHCQQCGRVRHEDYKRNADGTRRLTLCSNHLAGRKCGAHREVRRTQTTGFCRGCQFVEQWVAHMDRGSWMHRIWDRQEQEEKGRKEGGEGK